jgi:CheY-like chemotaxis protein
MGRRTIMSNEARALVLVVEDEALIRMHGCAVLESAGFEVLEAATADEAIVILEQHDHVHLLFSDIDMPGGMDGLELAEMVHARWPNIGLLITSGHRRPAEASLPDDGKFIAKPWREGDVIDQVKAILSTK